MSRQKWKVLLSGKLPKSWTKTQFHDDQVSGLLHLSMFCDCIADIQSRQIYDFYSILFAWSLMMAMFPHGFLIIEIRYMGLKVIERCWRQGHAGFRSVVTFVTYKALQYLDIRNWTFWSFTCLYLLINKYDHRSWNVVVNAGKRQ